MDEKSPEEEEGERISASEYSEHTGREKIMILMREQWRERQQECVQPVDSFTWPIVKLIHHYIMDIGPN